MKKKRTVSPNKAKANTRNWSKGLVMCSIKHFNSIKEADGLSFAEQMKVIKCKKLLQEIIEDWKPVL